MRVASPVLVPEIFEPVTVPDTAKFAPENVRLAESINLPPVLIYGIRPLVRPETARFVVVALVDVELVKIAVLGVVAPIGVLLIVPPEIVRASVMLPSGSEPVTASVSARSRAPHVYVEAPETRRIWPTVDEFERAVKAPVPLPWSKPVKVVAPVPPAPTAKALTKLRVVMVDEEMVVVARVEVPVTPNVLEKVPTAPLKVPVVVNPVNPEATPAPLISQVFESKMMLSPLSPKVKAAVVVWIPLMLLAPMVPPVTVMLLSM